jgi:hypothetical protein
VVTERDRVLLAFAAEHRFVLAGQIAALLGVSEPAAAGRMRTLGAGGYLSRERRLHGEPPSYQVTGAGLRAAGSDLPRPRKLDLACYRHDAGLGWLMLAAHKERFGPLRELISERRMRSHDGGADRAQPRFGVRLGGVGPGGRDRLHYPDLVIVTADGRRVAFELELSTKTPRRREGILAAYGADRRIDAVVYLVERQSAGRAISRSAARLGISSRIQVQNVRLDAGRGPAPTARGVARTRRPGAAARGGGGAGLIGSAR